MFPAPEKQLKSDSPDEEKSVVPSPDAATIRKHFSDSQKEFQKSKLCAETRRIVREFSKRKCDKIVAFGAGSMSLPHESTHETSNTHRDRHAALLVIRDALVAETTAKGKKVEIFLQDRSYTRSDHDILQEHGMTIVDGSIGCQMGFVLIDK